MDESLNGRTPEARAKQRAYLIASLESGDDLSELRELLRTAGVAIVGQTVQHRDRPHPNTYLGPGKLEEIKDGAQGAPTPTWSSTDDELSPRQERNLEQALGIPVVDRTAIILDIFASHAHTAEGKLQVELAQLEYNLARMRGLWTHLERLGGVLERRVRHAWPRRVADRDRPPAGPRPHQRAARGAWARSSATAARCAPSAQRARPAAGRPGGLHERGQVDAAQRADRRRGRRARPAVPHARPDHAHGAHQRPRRTCSPTPSASSASCRISSSRRSARRSRRRGWPT